MIDIKKKFTHEHVTRSKVLTVHAIEPEAKDTDEILCNLKSTRCQHVSCRNSMSQERVAAMCYDEMRNGKAKHETLFNVNLKDKVMDKEKDSYVSLETLLMNAKKNEHNLFLAAEKGARKFKQDVTVMMNSKTK